MRQVPRGIARGQQLIAFTFMGVVLPMVVIQGEVDVVVVSIVIVVAVMLAVAGPASPLVYVTLGTEKLVSSSYPVGTVHT